MLKNHVLATAISIGFALVAKGIAQERPALPPKTLLRKLELFETQKFNEITQKRSEVLTLLKGQLRTKLVGSREAISIQAAIDAIEKTESNEPFKIKDTVLPKPVKNVLNTQQLYEQILRTISVEVRNNAQIEKNQNARAVRLKLNGKEVYSGIHAGTYVIKVNQERVTANKFFPNRSNQSIITRKQITEYLKETDESHVVILVAAGASAALYAGGPKDVVSIVGGRADRILFLQPYICIGYNGLRRGGATEVYGEADGQPAVYQFNQK